MAKREKNEHDSDWRKMSVKHNDSEQGKHNLESRMKDEEVHRLSGMESYNSCEKEAKRGRRKTASTQRHDDTFHRGRNGPKKHQAKRTILYVVTGDKVTEPRNMKSILLHRMGNPRDLDFFVTKISDINKAGRMKHVIYLEFESFNKAALGKHLLHKSNRTIPNKLFCTMDKAEAEGEVVDTTKERQEKIEKAHKEIAERAESFIEKHDVKINGIRDKLVVLDEQLSSKRGVSIPEFDKLCNEKSAYEDKLGEFERQRKEFNRYMQCMKDKLQSLLTCDKFEKELQEIRMAFGVECRRFSTALPMYARREDILNTIKDNQVCVILGETGSGKSTQMVQYLYQSGFAAKGLIACTQPRKIAAVSLATHVSLELASRVGQIVGYKVGMQKKLTAITKVLYMTDHILLNECLVDRNLKQYSCILIDEAHERSIYTDLLLGMLKQALTERPELKVIITSATIEPDIFVKYFGGKDHCPVLKVSGRAFPVDVYWENDNFSERAFPEDYETKALNKAIEIHESTAIDDGDILVFLTAVAEIERCTEKITEQGETKIHCLQLHGRLKPEEQQLVFEKAPRGKRKIVFATNSAETSITIPGIKFVVDTGVVKEMRFDPRKNMNSLNVVSVSKSSANQRKGRAGRTTSGTCYRLYSEEDFISMETTTCPEILRIQVSQALLKLLELGVDPMKFDYVQSPSPETMKSALDELMSISAISKAGITAVGKWIAKLPLEPKLGLLIKKGIEFDVVNEALVIASCCNQSGIFYRFGTIEEKRAADLKKMKFCHRGGDLLTMLNVFREWIKIPEKEKGSWCEINSINGKAIKGVRDMTNEITSILKKELGIKIKYEFKLPEKVDSHLQSLIFDIMKANVGYFLGHEDAGYLIVNRNRRVKLHPSCAILALGLRPSWVVFNKVLKTSEDFMTEVTPVSNKAVTDAVKMKRLDIDVNALESERLKLAQKIPVGKHVKWKFVGPFHRNRRKVEEDISTECDGSLTVVEVSNRREVKLFCLPHFVEKASALLRALIEPIQEQLRYESREEHIGDERSGIRAVIRDGGSVVEVLMPHEYRSLRILQKECSFVTTLHEERIREMFISFGPIEQIWRPSVNKHGNDQFWGKVTFTHQQDAVAAFEHINNDRNAKIKIEPNTFQNTLVQQGFTMKLTWCRRPSKGHFFVSTNRPEDRPILLMSSPKVNDVPVSISVSKRSDLFLKPLPTDVTEESVIIALAEVMGISSITCKDRFRVVIPRMNVIWNADERDRQQAELSRIISKYADKESFRLYVREYRHQTVICIAFVTFSDPQLCNDIAKKLMKNQVKIGGNKIQVSLETRSSLHIRKGLYEVVNDDLQRTIDEYSSKNPATVLNIKTLRSGHLSLEITTDSPLELAQVKAKFQNIIGGEKLCWEGKKNINVIFTKSGRQRTQEIEKETNTVIIVDERDMTVTIQGLISNRRKAALFIEDYIKINSSTEETIFRLKGRGNPPGLMKAMLMKYGITLEEFKKKTDLSGVVLNLRMHEITLTGKIEAIDKALQTITGLKEDLREKIEGIQENDLPDCPICLCPVTESEICNLEYCGHAYCKVCLTSYIRHAVSGRQLPVSCAVENCNKLLVIRDFNTQIKMGLLKRKDLLDSALSCLVSTRNNEFRFCTTPDCSMVYRVTAVGKLFFCPSCRTKICTSCHIPYHEGLTCSMYNVAQKEGDSMLKWMKEDPLSRKICPNCNFGIEKTGGCNHVQCTLCRANICWSCMAFFSEMSECYKHMDAAHRTFV